MLIPALVVFLAPRVATEPFVLCVLFAANRFAYRPPESIPTLPPQLYDRISSRLRGSGRFPRNGADRRQGCFGRIERLPYTVEDRTSYDRRLEMIPETGPDIRYLLPVVSGY